MENASQISEERYQIESPSTRPGQLTAVIYTGGTIGMVKHPQTGALTPSADYLLETMKQNKLFNHQDLPDYKVIPLEPFLDSSRMTIMDSYRIAKKIEELYDQYSGFVIIHGTDTMAYTASILSYILVNLQKPVVLTGSQLPLSAPYSDGYFNLIGAIMSTSLKIPEVTIFFCNKLMRGNRCQKYSSWDIDAFSSPSLEPIIQQGAGTRISKYIIDQYHPIWPQNYDKERLTVVKPSEKVDMIMFYPSFNCEILKQYKNSKGLVIQAYGSGNGPDNEELLKNLLELHASGCVITIVTQTYTGIVNLGTYDAASLLKQAGCIGSNSMTPESAFGKLSYLIGLGLSQQEIEEQYQLCLRGEFTHVGKSLIE